MNTVGRHTVLIAQPSIATDVGFHTLSSGAGHDRRAFSQASYRKAPELCLAKFDELKQIGLDAFTRKYDPYHDIPLNENLPQPVIDLPISGEATDHGRKRRRVPAVGKAEGETQRSPEMTKRRRLMLQCNV